MNNKNEKACCFKTSVGGQALMEGVMMRGPQKMCVAVRQPDGEIFTEVSPIRTHPWQKWPFVRGIFNFIDSLVSGYKCLMKSAEVSMGEDADLEETKFDKWVAEKFGDKGTNFIMAVAAVLGGVLALVLFMVVPTALAGLLARFVPLGGWRALIEGVFKLVMLVGYMALVSRMKDIQRMFAYHGAEHKTIACYEAGLELTVENARRMPRHHPRCGTSFLFVVIVVAVLASCVVFALPVVREVAANPIVRILLHLLLLPIVVAVTYEINRFIGRHDNPVTRALSAPGMWMQNFTTFEPDDSMLEVAIHALKLVLPREKGADAW